jgi:hypothetical protein
MEQDDYCYDFYLPDEYIDRMGNQYLQENELSYPIRVLSYRKYYEATGNKLDTWIKDLIGKPVIEKGESSFILYNRTQYVIKPEWTEISDVYDIEEDKQFINSVILRRN